MASNKTRSSGVTRPASPTPVQTQATPQSNPPQMQSPQQQMPPVNTMNPANANQTPNNQNTPVQPGGVTALTQMTDDQLAQLVRDSRNAIMPNFLADAGDQTQAFVYQAGMNGLPQVMDAASFQQFLQSNNISQSDVLARSVNDIKYSAGGHQMSLTGKQQADMLMYSKFNYIGGKHGGQALGAGAYFARNGGVPTGYGNYTMVAAINPALARPITLSRLQTEAARFAQTHPKFNRAVGGFNTNFNNNNMSIWALAMGYNVITGDNPRWDSRTNIIDRSVLVYRK